MICCKIVIIDGCEYVKTTSDAGCYVVRDGTAYIEAIDPAGSERVYTEGGAIQDAAPDEIDDTEALNIIMGVSE